MSTDAARRPSRIALSVLVLLSACATEPIPLSQSRPAPREQIVALPPVETSQAALLIVARDSGVSTGGGIFLHVFLGGQRLGALDPSQHAQWTISAGEHELQVVPTNIIPGTYKPTELTFTARPGETRVYRVGFDSGGRVTIARDRTAESSVPR